METESENGNLIVCVSELKIYHPFLTATKCHKLVYFQILFYQSKTYESYKNAFIPFINTEVPAEH